MYENGGRKYTDRMSDFGKYYFIPLEIFLLFNSIFFFKFIDRLIQEICYQELFVILFCYLSA